MFGIKVRMRNFTWVSECIQEYDKNEVLSEEFYLTMTKMAGKRMYAIALVATTYQLIEESFRKLYGNIWEDYLERFPSLLSSLLSGFEQDEEREAAILYWHQTLSGQPRKTSQPTNTGINSEVQAISQNIPDERPQPLASDSYTKTIGKQKLAALRADAKNNKSI